MALSPIKRILAANCGQALLEAVISLPLITAGVMAVMGTVYFVLAHFMIEHWSYQAALCLAKEYPVQYCRRQLQNEMRLLSFHRLEKLRLIETSRKVSVEFATGAPLVKTAHYKIEIPLPLGGL